MDAKLLTPAEEAEIRKALARIPIESVRYETDCHKGGKDPCGTIVRDSDGEHLLSVWLGEGAGPDEVYAWLSALAAMVNNALPMLDTIDALRERVTQLEGGFQALIREYIIDRHAFYAGIVTPGTDCISDEDAHYEGAASPGTDRIANQRDREALAEMDGIIASARVALNPPTDSG